MNVTVELDPAEVWFLEAKAERRGLTLSEWIRHTVLAQHSKQLTTRDRIFKLHLTGATDAEISLRLQIGRGIVGDYRRELGLKPNKQHHQLSTQKADNK